MAFYHTVQGVALGLINTVVRELVLLFYVSEQVLAK